MLHELQVHKVELEMQNHELRKVQLELEASRAKYFDLYDLAPVAYLTVNHKGLIVESNLAASALLGVPHNDLKLGPFYRFVHKEDQHLFYLVQQRLIESGTPQGRDLRVQPTGKAQFWAHLNASVATDATGQHQLRITLTDISATLQMQSELRIAATAFESQNGIFVTDADKVILKVNHAFTEMTGYSAPDAVGQSPAILRSGRQDAAFYAAMWQSITHGGSWQGEIWNRRKNGEHFPEWLTITAVKDKAGNTSHYVANFTDISAAKIAEDKIKSLAYYDPLTQLPNRRLLNDRLEKTLASSVHHKRKSALLFIDLDNFKNINDTLGHQQGDLLLQLVAQRISTCVRAGDTVARLGGDEFVVMLEDLNEDPLSAAAQAQTVGEKILAELSEVYPLGPHQYHCSSSIGVTLFGGELQEPADEPLKRADMAMYQAKASGRNTLCFFDPAMQEVAKERFELEKGLRAALKQAQFALYYQAQCNSNGQVTGAEVLLRWIDPQRGMINPGQFIPLAEDTGLILPLGQWVLETACLQLAAWAKRPERAGLKLAVNVSAKQFKDENFVAQVLSTLKRTVAKAERISLEVTESLLIDHVAAAADKMATLRASGIHFSLDDFGTGFSSLAYLKRLPISHLKIDQGFVDGMQTDPNDAAIVRMILSLGSSMGVQVIAEGVETEAQRAQLSAMGCDLLQGFLINKPMPIAEFELFLDQAEVLRV